MASTISRPSSAQHSRSHSTTVLPVTRPPNRISRAISASALHLMASVRGYPDQPTSSPLANEMTYNDSEKSSINLLDPQGSDEAANGFSGPVELSEHSREVVSLNNKLVNAINRQSNLDDNLSAAERELESARMRVRELERDKIEHAEQISKGLLLRASAVQLERSENLAAVAKEQKLRVEADQEKKRMEAELENLTAALFEEANKMVSTSRENAKRQQEQLLRRNEQLTSQLVDTENLLRSQQEQLRELKLVIGQLTAERGDARFLTAPSTPGLSKLDSREERNSSISHESLPSTAESGVTPANPTSFSHLVSPILRTDLASYEDFATLLQHSKSIAAGSRTSSGSTVLGLGLGLGSFGGGSAAASPTVGHAPPNPINGTAPMPAPATPMTPVSVASQSSAHTATGPPLKDTKFYKRVLAEDIEPTLRLDLAPGLSWLARRSVLSAMSDGTLIVEPMPNTPTTKLYNHSCALCGESRSSSEHSRTHRFRTSEAENSQRYPLCKYCLGRVRSSCDFLGFLRTVRDGHWSSGDREEKAWEEAVRLREVMFWCRIGGGVVPFGSPVEGKDLRRPSGEAGCLSGDEEMREGLRRNVEEEWIRTGEINPRDITPIQDGLGRSSIERPRAIPEQVCEDDIDTNTNDDADISHRATPRRGSRHHEDEEETKLDLISDKSRALKESHRSGRRASKRLGINIPGAFISWKEGEHEDVTATTASRLPG